MQHAGEDFRSALPNVLEWLHAALTPPTSAKVLVHCQAGVSRSCSAVIAYLMWAREMAYTNALALVKSHRTVASPNMAFFTMLLEWEQTRLSQLLPAPAPAVKAAAGLGGDQLWVYQVCRQGQPTDPSTMVVTKLLRPPREATVSSDGAVGLDPRGCFILRTAAGLYGWIGKDVTGDDPCRAELESATGRIQRFEWAKEAAAVAEEAAVEAAAEGKGESLVPTEPAAGAEETKKTAPPAAAPKEKPEKALAVLSEGSEPAEILVLIAASRGGAARKRAKYDAIYETAAAGEAGEAESASALLPVAAVVVNDEKKDDVAAPSLTARGSSSKDSPSKEPVEKTPKLSAEPPPAPKTATKPSDGKSARNLRCCLWFIGIRILTDCSWLQTTA